MYYYAVPTSEDFLKVSIIYLYTVRNVDWVCLVSDRKV